MARQIEHDRVVVLADGPVGISAVVTIIGSKIHSAARFEKARFDDAQQQAMGARTGDRWRRSFAEASRQDSIAAAVD